MSITCIYWFQNLVLMAVFILLVKILLRVRNLNIADKTYKVS